MFASGLCDTLQTMDRAHVRKKWRPQGVSVILLSFLMDFPFDLYEFYFFGVKLGD